MGSVLGFPGIDPMDAVVGARIRRWRDQRGVAAEDLATALDLTPEALRRVEAGREHLDSAGLDAATRALHLPVWALAADRPEY
ncbi:transcriptional regulator with XRE-family HTH domain [Brevundimonas bullata]|uniref:Transcriptional regulator with XRE-family HTH domain n=1 Tax=Brevundimonas bullata TaxID=13160 RepID=A0A7W7IR15_9CAUL|nr:helix-turn-helix transcriptional regulator [Brevundimonas bullata]MBB4798940.1 transcriptional regulator with XRE-family HTH domain [Brevundimonas bullata]MBB6383900.1 transcriptional regulator with XRE-family HTH domain [Brevundimonas bullata]